LPVAITVAAGLALELALARGSLSGLPEMVRLAIAFGALVLLPGAALVRWTGAPSGGPVFGAVRALGLGIAWNAAAVVLAVVLRVPLARLLPALPFASATLWAVVLALPRRTLREPAPVEPRLRGAALAVVLL